MVRCVRLNDSFYAPDASEGDKSTTIEEDIRAACRELEELLVAKNRQYGNSALEPVRIFSRASNDEQLRVRIDDKLSRLARGDESIESDQDVINDLIGYLVLLKVARNG